MARSQKNDSAGASASALSGDDLLQLLDQSVSSLAEALPALSLDQITQLEEAEIAGKTRKSALAAMAAERDSRPAPPVVVEVAPVSAPAPAKVAGLVRMVRDEPSFDGGPVTADVHPLEVEGFAAHGWRKA